MQAPYKIFTLIFAIALMTFVIVRCTKENFVEPKDPFAIQRLDPDPNVLILGEGNEALKLKTNQANVITTGDGVSITGSVFIENSTYGDLRISSGEFNLVEGDTGNFLGFEGVGLIELPNEGIFKEISIPELTAAPIGFKKGSEFDLEAFSFPVNENRYYFYYENPDRFNAGLTNTSFDNIEEVAIDPTDPFFYLKCSMEGTPLGFFDNIGIAFSTQGLIPFRPLVDFYDIPTFEGSIYLTGTVPIEKYPVSVSGETVLSFFDKETDAEHFFSGEEFSYKMGINGQVNFEHDALDWLNLEVVLGQATTYLSIQTDGETQIKWAGLRQTPSSTPSDFINNVIGYDWDFLDYLAVSESKETFYGTIGTDLSDWEFGFKTESWMHIGSFDIDMGGIQLEMNPDRLFFEGRAAIAGFTKVSLSGDINKNGNFKITGKVSNGFDASCCGLSIDFSLKITVSLEHKDGKVTFKGKGKLKGEACLGKLCADFSVSASFSISSDGEFTACFAIGIGKLGFDVCLDFDKKGVSETHYQPVMSYIEIPIEEVPVENRFPVKSQVK
ncbi:MAG: hypothetical protein K9J16_01850 [Melioribacteraceae bacterium]|nr:hypothetical protein [Melioribacteraceae bacterium]MCF8353009.1 hypothetical protein [Melioribacteraceae bacterium]MCF8392900.1 hypothetical protein [Melioribacteraceae bacterium]MCF8417806.1 hypothetical protein [Melioribacteraceae bacterium]